jgi:hypothetical protein
MTHSTTQDLMKFLPSRCALSKMALIPHHSLKTIQTVLAIGRDSHHYAQIDKAKKGTANCTSKNGHFLAKFGAKMTSLFAMYTM